MKLKQRSSGYVDHRYYEAKKQLMKNRKQGCCIICGKTLPKRRRKYCSDKCFEEWFKQFLPRYFWSRIKERAFKRDGHRCVKCGKKEGEKYIDNDGFECFVGLIGDHIRPIALGGEEFDVNNVQTLCSECNKKKTRFDIKLIALARRISDDQTRLKDIVMA